MSFTRIIAFCIGLFSLVVGLLTYDSEIATSPVPVITGGLVLALAIFGLIPEFKQCESCHRKIPKKSEVCRHCGTKQENNR